MIYESSYKLEDFIIGLKWEDLSEGVRERARMCFLDLINALVLGSRSAQFKVGVAAAKELYKGGDIPVVGISDRFSFAGATAAMGHSSNAYDIDDGHKIIRAHPGTCFIGGVIAAACKQDSTYKEFLEALVAAYESTIRFGAAVIDHYKYYHSSGTFGPFGIATAAGKLWGYDRERLNNLLAVAEFNAPLIPAGRSVEYPSMNKDGVPFGAIIGAIALYEDAAGFKGNKHLLDGEEYKKYLDDLGEKYYITDLYFKPFCGCRWGHPAVDSVISIMREKKLTWQQIEKVVIKTFYQATRLSKIVPKTTDEAQYNIAFPVASAIVKGDFGYDEAKDEALFDPNVIDMMKRLSFEKDDDIDAMFPGRRCCRAEITLKDGTVIKSGLCEPRGEPEEGIYFPWIESKFRRMSKAVLTDKALDDIVAAVSGPLDVKLRDIIDIINRRENYKDL